MVRVSHSEDVYCLLPMLARIWERETNLSSLFITENILKAATCTSSTLCFSPSISALMLAYLFSTNVSLILPVYFSIEFQLRINLKQCCSKDAPVTLCIRNIQFVIGNVNFLAIGIRTAESPGIWIIFKLLG